MIAILLIGYALQQNDGFYAPLGLILLLGGTLVAVSALAWKESPALHRRSLALISQLPQGMLGRIVSPAAGFAGVALAGLATNIVLMVRRWPGQRWPIRFPQDHPFFLASLLVASAAIALMVWDRERARRVWFPAALAVAATLGVWMIRQSPDPHIDVMTVHRYAAAALDAGNNPYAMTFPNIYDDGRMYGAGLTADGMVLFGFPYPPLSLIMAMPGEWGLGDFRYAELAALLVGASLIAFAPRARSAEANVAPLAAALLLFTPRSLYVLEQGWTESFAICWLGAAVYAACRAPRLLPWALALLVSTKQHLVLAVPLALMLLLPGPWTWRNTWRLLGPSVLLPLCLAVPFLFWNAPAFINSAVLLQLREPFRADSLSLLSALSAAGWSPLLHPFLLLLLPLSAVLISFIMAWQWADRSISGFSVALALSLLLVFLVSKKAFCNYYYFVIAALTAAAAAWSDCEPRSVVPDTATPQSGRRDVHAAPSWAPSASASPAS